MTLLVWIVIGSGFVLGFAFGYKVAKFIYSRKLR